MCLVKTILNCVSKLNGIQEIPKDAQVICKPILRQVSTQNSLKNENGKLAPFKVSLSISRFCTFQRKKINNAVRKEKLDSYFQEVIKQLIFLVNKKRSFMIYRDTV